MRASPWIFFFLFSWASAAEIPPNLRTGDLIWVNSDCGSFCQSIIDTTKAQFGGGPDVNHIGLIEVDGGEIYIYEAVPGAGTLRTKYSDLVARLDAQKSRIKVSDRILFGSIRPKFRELFVGAVRDAKFELGWPYNALFKFQSGKLRYCSQWVQLLVQKRNGDKPLWTWRPMMFLGKTWAEYFRARGVKAPVGELGVSPLGMYVEGKGKIFD